MTQLFLRIFLVLVMLGTANGHTGFENQTEVHLFPDRMEMIARTSVSLAWMMLGAHAPSQSDEAGQNQALPLLTAVASQWFEMVAGGRTMVPKKVDCVFELNRDVALTFVYERPKEWPVVFTARFFRLLGPLDSGSISFYDQTDCPDRRDVEPTVGKILMVNDASISVMPKPLVAAIFPSHDEANLKVDLSQFFILGMKHIMTGYDHLLFLLALIMGCRSLRASLIFVTVFSVAHSISLALASVGVVHFPNRWVESFIALSIVFVGVDNGLGNFNEVRRGILTFGFGLIHGLGFASAFTGIGLGQRAGGIALSLLTFNLGVEFVQLLLVVTLLPLIGHLLVSPMRRKFAVPVVSGGIALVGVIWFFQRVFAQGAG